MLYIRGWSQPTVAQGCDPITPLLCLTGPLQGRPHSPQLITLMPWQRDESLSGSGQSSRSNIALPSLFLSDWKAYHFEHQCFIYKALSRVNWGQGKSSQWEVDGALVPSLLVLSGFGPSVLCLILQWWHGEINGGWEVNDTELLYIFIGLCVLITPGLPFSPVLPHSGSWQCWRR